MRLRLASKSSAQSCGMCHAGMRVSCMYGVILPGTGRVGSALFPLLEEGAEKWEKKHSLRIVVAGIINHDLMLMDYINGIDKKDWQNRLQVCAHRYARCAQACSHARTGLMYFASARNCHPIPY